MHDTSRFGGGHDTFGTQYEVPRIDAAGKSTSTFDPYKEVYGKDQLAVPGEDENDGFYAGFTAER